VHIGVNFKSCNIPNRFIDVIYAIISQILNLEMLELHLDIMQALQQLC